MICTRCWQWISFNQWANDTCFKSRGGLKVCHLAKSQSDIRHAYAKHLEEATYARVQP